MAVFDKLLLSTGGGIVSSLQQADKDNSQANILIGLGGTGVHSIRTIKTQVYSRLKPDDPNALVPEYHNIQFIGVDTTKKSQGGTLDEKQKADIKRGSTILPLDDTEFFYIGNALTSRALSNHLTLSQREDLNWLRYEDIDSPNLSDSGAGGIRQIGRFMMMDRSHEFIAKVSQAVDRAKSGLNSPQVSIHIFAGLSGGTGSGTFLDVCYMLRETFKESVKLFGYFFLPDVNLSNISQESVDVRNYVMANGYAAMQELDYCMSLDNNGGQFNQFYRGGKRISWNKPPVDMCHLICATDENNNVIPDAYNYAMNVTAEYILDFISLSNSSGASLQDHLSNFQQIVAQANNKKTFGSNMNYIVIGASCAGLPLREINTFLASELFDKLSQIKVQTPNKDDVMRMAMKVIGHYDGENFASFGKLVDDIRMDVDDRFAPAEYDYRYVLEMGDADVVKDYASQFAQKVGQVEANARSLMSKDNKESLLGRMRTYLEFVIKDINRGPMYAYRMLRSAESHNFINVIDGLIQEARAQVMDAQNNKASANDYYKYARDDFMMRNKRSILDNDQKRFATYEDSMIQKLTVELEEKCYMKALEVLEEFRRQVDEITGSYYSRLNKVMESLMETFEENKLYLADPNVMQRNNCFVMPMMTIDELRTSLNNAIEKIDVAEALRSIMDSFISHEEEWSSEDELKISRLVTKFFTEQTFSKFADRTITSYLRDKYENKYGSKIENSALTNYIYEDWMKLLEKKAKPLFNFDSAIWKESDADKMAHISFPADSEPIENAVNKIHEYSDKLAPRKSCLSDRIYIMCCACGLPLSAYLKLDEYEKVYYSAKTVGIHYYEGKEMPGIEFNDWSLLPSIKPQCRINTVDDHHSVRLLNILNPARELFTNALKYKLIDNNGIFFRVDADQTAKISALCDECEKALNSVNSLGDLSKANEVFDELKKYKELPIVKAGPELKLDMRGMSDPVDRYVNCILQDYFVSSPALRLSMSKFVDEYEKLNKRVNALLEGFSGKTSNIEAAGNVLNDFSRAVFAGVIDLQEFKVTYTHTDFGTSEVYELSKDNKNFPFGCIPAYQAYVTFQTLEKDITAEIVDLTEKMLDGDHTDELRENATRLKDIINDDMIATWAQDSSRFAEKPDIINFLKELNKSFMTWCRRLHV